MRTTTLRSHDRLLPTLPGLVSGIVHYNEDLAVTVQCAVCFRTLTVDDWHKPLSWAVIIEHWDFQPDPGQKVGHTSYRRCPDCRAESLHPAQPPGSTSDSETA